MLLTPLLNFKIEDLETFLLKVMIFWIEFVIVDNFEYFLELILMKLMKFLSKTFH